MDERLALQAATDHVFIAGMGDLGEALCRANVAFGLAKIHSLQRRLGRTPNACFVGAPDATITRNPRRWRKGFGYGGSYSVDDDLAILDSKPNACGMLVGALDSPPDEATIREAASALREHPPALDGVQLTYDLDESNHFADVCELEERLVDDPALVTPDHLFVIHSSGHEHRQESPLGPGLYIDESPELQAMSERHDTPWGSLSFLVGEPARAYYRFCSAVQDFNARRRALFGEQLFGTFHPLCNATHQGFRRPGLHYLGAYGFEDPTQIYPLTLGPDQPVYLLRPKKNFSPKMIDDLAWTQRARSLGLLPRLLDANILPHGGGYALRGHLLRIEGQTDDDRRFLIDPGAREEAPPFALQNIREIPYAYRGNEVLHRTQTLHLAEPVARYRVRFVVK
ncbi:MAG: hypothetical protein KAI47_22530 [Deltaproteobacteria bacterium]|nr:hypothetical protein [Deltaproteobacteria bacterium]